MTMTDSDHGDESDEVGGAGITLLTDPALGFAAMWRRGAAALCLLVGLGCLAAVVRDARFAPLAVAGLLAGTGFGISSLPWSQQRLRAWFVAQRAVPDAATVVREWTTAGAVRHVTLRADGADPSFDFTWRLPASWGEPVRLDRMGRRVAVFSRADRREFCAPVLRGGLPFVVPDHVLAALIALVAADVSLEARHPRLQEQPPVELGTIPLPPALPVTFAPSPESRIVWALGASATVAITAGGVWVLHETGIASIAVVVFILAALMAICTGAAHSAASCVVIGADGIDVIGPLTTRRSSPRVPWTHVGQVELRWMLRSTREAQESGDNYARILGAAALGAMGGRFLRLRLTDRREVVGDLIARLVRGDIVPEVDTVMLVLHARSGRRIANISTRTSFQSVRSFLVACAERGVRVTAGQGDVTADL